MAEAGEDHGGEESPVHSGSDSASARWLSAVPKACSWGPLCGQGPPGLHSLRPHLAFCQVLWAA